MLVTTAGDLARAGGLLKTKGGVACVAPLHKFLKIRECPVAVFGADNAARYVVAALLRCDSRLEMIGEMTWIEVSRYSARDGLFWVRPATNRMAA
ncbi:hypothetical protein ATO11_16650 [Pseudaestuariivita atlantica]|uniref:Uncharacterized protein n=2 Tax=Pseudaestuariivita atlantica TaxID=1317121 RepID=A0A0L1JLL5_9RHOB|nr:hypothetical protein ATO11_16650 [Pseudaestuariivita atlantica]